MVSILPSPTSSNVYDPGLGLIFTDAKGRIVFADNRFLALVGQPEARKLVGEPLDRVINVARDSIGGLIQDIAHAGSVHERTLTIQRGDGYLVQALCTGVASYDDRNAFIGADLTLRDPQHATTHQMVTHHDVLQTRIQQIEAEADAQATHHEVLAQLYFTAQISTIQVLLGRMGGPRIQQYVEDFLNQASAGNKWPIQVKGGHFLITASSMPDAAYAALLRGVMDYGSAIVGLRLLVHEMRALDGQMKPETCEVAAELGLRDWLK
jgi:hypothetical protein